MKETTSIIGLITMRIKLSIVFVLLASFALSQNSFEFIHSSINNELVTDILEKQDSSILMVGYEYNYSQGSNEKSFIISVSPTGDTLIYKYSLSDTLIRFYNIWPSFDGNYYIGGSVLNYSLDKEDFALFKLDTDLQIIDYTIFNFNQKYVNGLKVLHKKQQNGFHILISASYEDFSQFMVLCSMDKHGKLIRSKTFSEFGFMLYPTDITFGYDSTEIYIVGIEFDYADGSKFSIDTSYIDYTLKRLQNNPGANINAKKISDSLYILCAIYTDFNPYQDDDIGVFTSDSTLDIENIIYIGNEGIQDCPAYSNAIDFKHNDSIFLFCNEDRKFFPYPSSYSWLSVYQLDKNLNIRISQLFGGDAYYVGDIIKSTNDGGYIIAARRYDYQAQDDEYDVYVKKVSGNDLITNIPSYAEEDIVTVFPNPGENKLVIQSEKPKLSFRMFDIKGQMVIDLRNIPGISTIDCSRLKPGVYFYMVSDQHQVLDKGKWIKR